MNVWSSRTFHVRARGGLACFTRPELKVERVSYEVMTPSAARGVLEAVLWKPAIAWRVHAITVCAPIRWMSFLRNEVSERASPKREAIVADENRVQRHTVALRDVDYVISASFTSTPKAGPGDNLAKFTEMFERRIGKGQHHSAPYLGCREFACDVSMHEGEMPQGIDGADRPLGLMLWDIDYAHTPVRPLFFEARLDRGVLRVPPREEVVAFNEAPS